MGRLHHYLLHAIGNQTLKGLLHIVDFQPLALGENINDRLAGEGAAHFIIRIGRGNGVLHCADGFITAVVVAGAEADHQNHIFFCAARFI